MVETFDPSPNGGIQTQGLAPDRGVPVQNSCHIFLKGIHWQCLGLELQEVQDMLHRCANGILTPTATPASEALPSVTVHLSRGVTGGRDWVGVVTGDPICLVAEVGSRTPSGGEGSTKISLASGG